MYCVDVFPVFSGGSWGSEHLCFSFCEMGILWCLGELPELPNIALGPKRLETLALFGIPHRLSILKAFGDLYPHKEPHIHHRPTRVTLGKALLFQPPSPINLCHGTSFRGINILVFLISWSARFTKSLGRFGGNSKSGLSGAQGLQK